MLIGFTWDDFKWRWFDKYKQSSKRTKIQIDKVIFKQFSQMMTGRLSPILEVYFSVTMIYIVYGITDFQKYGFAMVKLP